MALILHSVASTLMGRPGLGLKDLANPALGNNYDPQLWKALAYARQGKWAEAREKFKNAEPATASLPADLQRIVLCDAMRAALEVKDYSGAAKRSSDPRGAVGVPPALKPAVSVMRGRLAEALGRDKDALSEYKVAVDSSDRPAAAEGKLYQIALLQKRDRNQPGRRAARAGDAVGDVARRPRIPEVRALESMAKIYADTGRYSESLAANRTRRPSSSPIPKYRDRGRTRRRRAC